MNKDYQIKHLKVMIKKHTAIIAETSLVIDNKKAELIRLKEVNYKNEMRLVADKEQLVGLIKE